jgi:hypothetical protein
VGVFVLGMHRSGTSLVTALLNRMGAFVGEQEELLGADAHNPSGYWERVDVLHLHEAALEALGARWDHVEHVDLQRLPEDTVHAFNAEALRIVSRLAPHGTWAVKDPRLCFLAPLWRKVATRPAYVLIHRSPLAVAASLQERNGFSLDFGLDLWERYNRAALVAMHDHPSIVVSYEQLVAQPASIAAGLLAALHGSGLRPPAAETMQELVQPSLNHASPRHESVAGLTKRQVELREQLLGLTAGAATH